MKQTQTFDSFLTDRNNEEAVASLKKLIGENAGGYVFLCGPTGTGKTHLLRALEKADPKATYCASDELLDTLLAFVKRGDEESFFASFSGNLLIDDAYCILKTPEVSSCMKELCDRIAANGGYTVFSFIGYPNAEGAANPHAVLLYPPGRETRIRYCEERMKQEGLAPSAELAAEIVDAQGETIQSLNAAVLRLAAESRCMQPAAVCT